MSLLRPGHNVWRIERAGRAAVLVDGAAFFEAVRAACLKAQHSIFMVGWDIDSRTRLVGDDGQPADGHAGGLRRFPDRTGRRRGPTCRSTCCCGTIRCSTPASASCCRACRCGWRTPRAGHALPRQLRALRQLAAPEDRRGRRCPGLLRRPRPHHPALGHARRIRSIIPHRVDPGRPALPAVPRCADDGRRRRRRRRWPLLARERWCRAQGGEPAGRAVRRSWPDELRPGLHRRRHRHRPHPAALRRRQAEVREVEALFVDSIDRAERAIYIENQFLTSPRSQTAWRERLQAEARARSRDRGAAQPRFLDRATHHAQRPHPVLAHALQQAGGDRVRLLYPAVEQGGKSTDTMIHSKIMVIDDRFLRVGSANLNNRSMGADTECDLAIEARNDAERARHRAACATGCWASIAASRPAMSPPHWRRTARWCARPRTLTRNGHSLQPDRRWRARRQRAGRRRRARWPIPVIPAAAAARPPSAGAASARARRARGRCGHRAR